MSRQITISRDELGAAHLDLNNPSAGYYVSDDWRPGATEWQRYTATPSAWTNGERVVGQRKLSKEEIFTIYVHASTPAGLAAKIATIHEALAQFRYTLTIEWDGATTTYNANGAADIRYVDEKMDPILHVNGWAALEITIPRDPQ
jgi:hypothetical protein